MQMYFYLSEILKKGFTWSVLKFVRSISVDENGKTGEKKAEAEVSLSPKSAHPFPEVV